MKRIKINGDFPGQTHSGNPPLFSHTGFVALVMVAAGALPGGALQSQTEISGTYTNGYTLDPGSTNYVINAGAYITGMPAALVAFTDPGGSTSDWTITNNGIIGRDAIQSENYPYNGVIFNTRGLVTFTNNGSVIGNASTSTRAGMRVNLTNSSLNKGAIIYNNGLIAGDGNGIDFVYSGDADKLVNTGTIMGSMRRTASAVNQLNGVIVSRGPAVIENSGYIIGGRNGVVIGNNARARGYYVINTGTIVGDTPISGVTMTGLRISNDDSSGTIVNEGGVIRGATYGIVTAGSATLIENRNNGIIEGVNSHGVSVASIGTYLINNAASILGGNYAVRIEGADGTINNINGGVISADGTGADDAGVYAAVSTYVENDATSLIMGRNGINLAGGGTITNTGTINGTGGIAIDFTDTGTDVGLLVLDTGASLNGSVRSAKAAGNAVVLQGSGTVVGDFIGANATSGFESLTMNGSVWTLGGTIAITGSAADAIAVNGDALTLGGGLVTPNNAGVTISGGGALTFHFANDTTFGGDIAGSGTFIHAGSGLLELTGANTLAGVTGVINGGILKLPAAPASSALVLGGGATAGFLEYSGAGPWTNDVTLAGAGGGFSVNGGTLALTAAMGGSGAFMKTGAGALDIRGASFASGITTTEVRDGALIAVAVALAGNVTLSNATATLFYEHTGADHTDNRNISGSGNFIKTGAGLLNLTGDVTYTGNTTIEEGTLQGKIGTGGLQVNTGATYKVADGVTDFQLAGITGGGNVDLNAASLLLDVATTGSFYFTGNLTSANPGSKLVKTGAGTLELLSAVALGGGTEIRDGTLKLADQSFVTTPVVLGTGTTAGLIEYTGAAPWAHDITLATGGAGGFAIASGSRALGGAFEIQGTGTFVKAGAGALDVRGANFGSGVAGTAVRGGMLLGDAASFAGDVTLSNNATLLYEQNATATDNRLISGEGNLIKTGGGLLNLTGANTYSGNTTVRSGTLQGNIGTGGLQVDTGATYKVAAGVTGFQLASITGGGVVDLNAANLLLDVATTGSFYFTGSLRSANPDSKLVKTGDGTLDLLSAVALDGGAEIQAGTLRLVDQSFVSAPVVLGTGSTSGLIEYTGATAWAHTITLAAGGGGGFSVASGTQTISGITINGSGDFVKAGAGTLDISGATIANANAGSTRVLGGTLRGNAAKFKTGGIEIAGAASAIEFNETGAAASYAGAITGAGSLVKTGAGSLSLTGANTYGDTIIRAGLLEGSIGAGSLTIERSGTYRVGAGANQFVFAGLQGNGTLDLASADMVVAVDSGTRVYDFSGRLTGGSQFVKTGSGVVDLRSAVALTGGARIEEGVVMMADQSLLNAPVVLGTGSTSGFVRFNSPVAWTRTITLDGVGGGFDVSDGLTTTVSGTVQVVGADAQLLKTGSGVLDITDATLNNVSKISIQSGVLRGNVAKLPAAVDTRAAGTVEFYENADATYSGVTTGAGSLLKTGAGTLTVTGSLAHTGVTTISRGALKLGAAGVLATDAIIAIQTAGALDLGGINQTVGSIDNAGAVYLDATVNSRVGMILSSNTLAVTHAATGAGKLLVRLNETEDGGGADSAVVMTSEVGIAFTPEIAERVAEGPYEWALEKSSDGKSITLAQGMISPEVAAAGGLEASAWHANRTALSAISDRLMMERSVSRPDYVQLWAGWMHSEDTLDTDLYTNAKSTISGIQIGGEWNAGGKQGHPVFIGVFYDQSTADFELDGRVSESSADIFGIGAYASYRSRPLYVDVVLRNAREEYEVDVHYAGTHSFATKGQGIAASVEVGSIFTSKRGWNIEPQAQLTYLRHTFDKTTDDLGREISVENENTLEGRIGVRVWRRFVLVERFLSFRPFVRGSLAYSTGADGSVTVGGVSFNNAFGGQVTQFDGGFNLEWTSGFYFQAGGAWYSGSKLDGYSFNVAGGISW